MSMEYKKLHAYPNDCILYKKDFELLKNCQRCGLWRYKLKQKDDDTIEEMENHDPQWRLCGIFPSIQGWNICLWTQMMLRIFDGMQMRGNVKECMPSN